MLCPAFWAALLRGGLGEEDEMQETPKHKDKEGVWLEAGFGETKLSEGKQMRKARGEGGIINLVR